MEYIQKLEDIQNRNASVVTLGKFDGVHRGHQKLLSLVKQIGQERQLDTVVFTFAVSPQVCMGMTGAEMLMTNRERRETLEQLGIDLLVECPFTDEIRTMEAEAFVSEILIRRLRAKAVVIGTDFHFGRNRRGNAEYLQRIAPEYDLDVRIVEKEQAGGRDISSTGVREALSRGDMEQVNTLLGAPYRIEGEILHGRHLGHSLGFPTINQKPEPGKMLPPNGVYVSRTDTDGHTYHSVSNIGCKPTVNGAEIGVETYLFGCDADLYGKTARVELLSFLRPEQKFDSLEKLQMQLESDVREAQDYFHRNAR